MEVEVSFNSEQLLKMMAEDGMSPTFRTIVIDAFEARKLSVYAMEGTSGCMKSDDLFRQFHGLGVHHKVLIRKYFLKLWNHYHVYHCPVSEYHVYNTYTVCTNCQKWFGFAQYGTLPTEEQQSFVL